MALPVIPLPANVLDAVARGNAVEAIKLLRAATGLGLKEAKDAIDAHVRGTPAHLSSSAPAGPLPPSVVEALTRGNKIEAIKLLRRHTGLGLKEAKEAVEASQQGADAKLREHSPGEVPKAGTTIAWVVALLVGGGVAYYFLRGAG
jgi:ribosomal protein L7/L12